MASGEVAEAAERVRKLPADVLGLPIYDPNYEAIAAAALGMGGSSSRTNELLELILEALDRLDPNRR